LALVGIGYKSTSQSTNKQSILLIPLHLNYKKNQDKKHSETDHPALISTKYSSINKYTQDIKTAEKSQKLPQHRKRPRYESICRLKTYCIR